MHPSKVTLRPKVRRPMAWDSTQRAPRAQQPEPSALRAGAAGCGDVRRSVNCRSTAARFARDLRALLARLGQSDRDCLLPALDQGVAPLARLERAALHPPHGAANVLLRAVAISFSARAPPSGH